MIYSRSLLFFYPSCYITLIMFYYLTRLWINLTTKRRWWRRSVVARISTDVDEKSIDRCGGGSTGASLFETWPIPLGQPVTPTGSACAPTFPIRGWVCWVPLARISVWPAVPAPRSLLSVVTNHPLFENDILVMMLPGLD